MSTTSQAGELGPGGRKMMLHARGIVSVLRSYRNYRRLQSLERPGRELA